MGISKIASSMLSRVALLSDIHGNSTALQSVLDDVRDKGCTRLFVLGDIIPGVDPHGCVRMLRSWSEQTGAELGCIKGNAEAYLATPDRNSLIEKSDADMVDILKGLQWDQDHLSGPDLDWIYSLPDTLTWDGAYLVHDSPMDRLAVRSQAGVPPEYGELKYYGRGIARDMTNSEREGLLEFMRFQGVDRVFCGHTHCPFYEILDDLLVCNVGSTGMPLDGDPRPSWVMLDIDKTGRQYVSIRRVTYDISSFLQLIDRTPDYPGFHVKAYQEAYRQMFLHGNHWRFYMPNKSPA